MGVRLCDTIIYFISFIYTTLWEILNSGPRLWGPKRGAVSCSHQEGNRGAETPYLTHGKMSQIRLAGEQGYPAPARYSERLQLMR